MTGEQEAHDCPNCGNTVFVRKWSVADCVECHNVFDPWDNAGRNNES